MRIQLSVIVGNAFFLNLLSNLRTGTKVWGKTPFLSMSDRAIFNVHNTLPASGHSGLSLKPSAHLKANIIYNKPLCFLGRTCILDIQTQGAEMVFPLRQYSTTYIHMSPAVFMILQSDILSRVRTDGPRKNKISRKT